MIAAGGAMLQTLIGVLVVAAIVAIVARSATRKSARIGRAIAASREPSALDAVAHERLAMILRTEHARVAAAGLDAQSVERALAGLADLQREDAAPEAIGTDVSVRAVAGANEPAEARESRAPDEPIRD